jgi:hypothetical protein
VLAPRCKRGGAGETYLLLVLAKGAPLSGQELCPLAQSNSIKVCVCDAVLDELGERGAGPKDFALVWDLAKVAVFDELEGRILHHLAHATTRRVG